MRISDWSSDVCSSDLSARARRRRCSAISSRRGADEKCHAKIQRGHSSVHPELVEGPFFLSALKREERCFDKLSTNGKEQCPLCALRSEERRVGNGCVRTCRSRGSR